MKKAILGITAITFFTIGFASCKKKEPGICYCKYLSGDKKEYDVSSLTRSKQIDSCYVLVDWPKALQAIAN